MKKIVSLALAIMLLGITYTYTQLPVVGSILEGTGKVVDGAVSTPINPFGGVAEVVEGAAEIATSPLDILEDRGMYEAGPGYADYSDAYVEDTE
ncbi:MAG TPA: hypothetical protein VHA52_09645 [Candidatus Babeliaceae bacterium]|nr:hypothetical protein [Candidatus Babeliaceae bacterium]